MAWTAVGLLMVTIPLGSVHRDARRRPGAAGRGSGRRRRRTGPPSSCHDNPVGAASSPDPPDSLITDEMIAATARGTRQPEDGTVPIRPNPEVLVPIAHGFAAIGAFVLVVMAAIM